MSIEDLVLDQLNVILGMIKDNPQIDLKWLENALLEAMAIIRA